MPKFNGTKNCHESTIVLKFQLQSVSISLSILEFYINNTSVMNPEMGEQDFCTLIFHE